MARRRTILERVWPNEPEFIRLAGQWKPDALTNLLSYFWKGCDALVVEIIKPASGVSKDDVSLERTLNSNLAPRVTKNIPINCPFYFQHKPDEFQSLHSNSAQPPEPDFAFIPYKNARCMFPIEAKVLQTDGQVSGYTKEVHGNFIERRYAPFSTEGGMLAYLLEGTAETLFANLSDKLRYSPGQSKSLSEIRCTLQHHPKFNDRHHKFSDHKRKARKGAAGDRSFRCHHMILEVGPAAVLDDAAGSV